MPDWFDGIERVGVAVTVLVFLGLGIWKAFRFLGLRLFGETGIVTRVGDRFIAFMDQSEHHMTAVLSIVKHESERGEAQTQLCREMAHVHSPGGACDPRPLKQAGLAAADAIVALADGDAAAVRTHAAEIKRHLEPAK